MANPEASLEYIEIPPGVTPITDDTLYSAQNWTSSVGIRFRNGKPEKRGGYQLDQFSGAVDGVPRSIYSTAINGIDYTFIGTSTRLYVLINGTLTNITPFVTSSTAAASSLSTDYNTLANNPITTTSGSNVVVVADVNYALRQVGDTVTLSGSNATVGGITTGQVNAAQVVRSVGVGLWTFWASSNASSSATGGGNAVIAASGLIECINANTMKNGDRVSMSGASTFGGVTATQINKEFIIRSVTAGHFYFMTSGTATSAVSSGGGVSTVFFPPIAAGNADEKYGSGYGEGEYSVGLYGVNKTSSSARSFPQIWFFDRFGDFVMLTPGNQGALYEWSGNLANAPVITANSPTAINYMFVASNTVIVFGNGKENEITASDQGNRTVWSGTAQNQYFDGVVAGAGRFIGAIKLNGINLIFTEKQAYTFQQIGLPNIWAVNLLANEGMISPLGGFQVNGTAYWMGINNWFTWNGGDVEVMPSNIFPVSTILKYVFQNINRGQKSKCFCWFNELYRELRFHYPSAAANDPDSVAVCNILDNSWWPDQEARVAAEIPTALGTYPLLSDLSGNIYQHEIGTDAVNAALSFSLTSNLRTLGKNEALLSAFVPDSIQTGAITVTIAASQWPNSPLSRTTDPYTVNVGDGRENFGQEGRFWQYTISGAVIGQAWRMGQWAEERQMSGDGP